MPSPKEFALRANPSEWAQVAEDLRTQAILLRSIDGTTHHVQRGTEMQRFDGRSRALYLLCGFALENIIKAYRVLEDPSLVADGLLKKGPEGIRSHDLVKLAAPSKLLPQHPQREEVLRAFSAGLESWARYPCGLDKDDVRDRSDLPTPLWEAFLDFTKACAPPLVEALRAGWDGPHDVGYAGDFDVLFDWENPKFGDGAWQERFGPSFNER